MKVERRKRQKLEMKDKTFVYIISGMHLSVFPVNNHTDTRDAKLLKTIKFKTKVLKLR